MIISKYAWYSEVEEERVEYSSLPTRNGITTERNKMEVLDPIM